jgi:SAM-dependent methyltransferase
VADWDPDDPGNRAIEAERDGVARARLEGSPRDRVLDLGCGRGEVLGRLGLRGVGIDLRPREAALPVARGDAARLPVAADSIDLVVAFNVLSSIPADQERGAVAAEIDRVLRPGGRVLWYDQRWPNPANRATRPVTRAHLRRLFPGATLDLAPATLVPAVARRFPARYEALARLRPLRTHLIGTITPRS